MCEFCDHEPYRDFQTFDPTEPEMDPRRPSPQEVVQGPGGTVACLGAGITCVFGRSRSFIAPDLIFHYVHHHGYRPPRAFVRALLESPLPTEPAYLERLRTEFPANQGTWDVFAHRVSD